MALTASALPRPPDDRLRDKLRTARLAQGEKMAAIVSLRDAATLRLAMLRDELLPIAGASAEARGFIDLALVPGDPARLWIDMVSYVVMAPSPRIYRLQRDTLDGHEVVHETADLAEMTEAVINHIAHRMIERQHHLVLSLPQPAVMPGTPRWWLVLAGLGGFAAGASLVWLAIRF
ncbi:MAG: hypothetical protein HYX36_11270 [Rhizobiales bacterium]|nr:hypothetical protein [Hyphomicrobiales bacterium]